MVFRHSVAVGEAGYRQHWCLRESRGGCAWPRREDEELGRRVQALVAAFSADAELHSLGGEPISGAARQPGVAVGDARLFVVCQADPFAELEVRAHAARLRGAGWQPALLTTAPHLGWRGLPEVPTGRLAERYGSVEVEDCAYRSRSGRRVPIASAAGAFRSIARRAAAGSG
jgi:hypothetical protein